MRKLAALFIGALALAGCASQQTAQPPNDYNAKQERLMVAESKLELNYQREIIHALHNKEEIACSIKTK